MSPVSTDRIEKTIHLRATRQRVWRALSDSQEFGHWFGVKFDAPFKPGAFMRGVIVPTNVSAEVAAAQKPYEGRAFEITIEKMEPARLFSFRWQPFAIEPDVDYSEEPTTLVVFTIEDELSEDELGRAAPNGVRLTVTESGFDRIPLARRATAFTANEQGWTMVAKLLGEYLNDARQ